MKLKQTKLRDLWEHINVSTLMVLPMFSDMVSTCRQKRPPRLHYPIQLLFFEYGLINTCLNKDEMLLYCIFNADTVLSDLRKTNGSYYSLSERIIDSKHFVFVERVDDLIVYCLRIPKEYYDDVELIVQSKYSELSKSYKNVLNIAQDYVPLTKHERAKYIVTQNIPYAIAVKGVQLREELQETLGALIDLDQEFYTVFNSSKESLDYQLEFLTKKTLQNVESI